MNMPDAVSAVLYIDARYVVLISADQMEFRRALLPFFFPAV